MVSFEKRLAEILLEEVEPEFESAVGIVQMRNRWLLGLSKSHGDRKNKWCHPGGGIDRGESPKKAAVREVFEETGIRCKAVGEPFRDIKHKGVAFVHCKVTSHSQKLNPNEEFAAVGFFTLAELRVLKPLYKNVKKLIDQAKKC